MLRYAAILTALVCASAIAAPVPKVKVKDAEAIQGNWKVVELTHDGKLADKDYQGASATLDKDSFVVKETNRKADESMSYKIDAEKKQIDLTPKNVGVDLHLQGVYELDGDTLMMAISMGGKGERPKEAKSGPGVAFIKMQRIKEEKK